MTIAEIKGKISSTGSNLSDRLEDLLTSDVFGPLRYLPFDEGLLPILKSATHWQNGSSLEIEEMPDQSMEVIFWPM